MVWTGFHIRSQPAAEGLSGFDTDLARNRRDPLTPLAALPARTFAGVIERGPEQVLAVIPGTLADVARYAFLDAVRWSATVGGLPAPVKLTALSVRLRKNDDGAIELLARIDHHPRVVGGVETPVTHTLSVDVKVGEIPLAERVPLRLRADRAPLGFVRGETTDDTGGWDAAAVTLTALGFSLDDPTQDTVVQGLSFATEVRAHDPAQQRSAVGWELGVLGPQSPSGQTFSAFAKGFLHPSVVEHRPTESLPEVASITRGPRAVTSLRGAVAGFARVALKLPPNKPLAGYSLLGSGLGKSEHHPMKVRAMYLEDARGERVAVAVLDLMSASRYLHERVAALTRTRVGLDVDRVILCGTHTHTGPGGFYGNRLYDVFASHHPGFDRDLADHLAVAAAHAIEQAFAQAVPARVRVDVERVWGVSRNRSLPAFEANEDRLLWNTQPGFPGHSPPPNLTPQQRRIDPRVVVLSAYNLQGERIGVFATFGCHNTGYGPHSAGGPFYDPDWAGVVARTCEAAPGGAPVVLMALSGAGDQSPMPPDDGPSLGPQAQGEARAEYVGAGVAAALLRANMHGDLGATTPALLKLQPSPVHALHVLQVNAHAFGTVPGEPTAFVAWQIEQGLLAGPGVATASVLGYAGDYAGYFTTRAEFRQQHDEGASTLFGVASSDHLAARLAELCMHGGPLRPPVRTAEFEQPAGDDLAIASLLPPPLA